MPKIYVNGRFLTQPLTGVQRYAVEVLRQWDGWLQDGSLDARRWQIELLAPRSGVIHDLGLRVIPLRMFGRMSGNLWEQVDLPAAAEDGVLFCPCTTAPIRALTGKTPVIVMVQDLSYRQFPQAYSGAFRLWYDLLMPILFANATRILTVAHCEKKVLLERFPDAAARIRVVQNGCVDPEIAHQLANESEEPADLPEKYVLYVGSLSQRKNVQGVMAACEILFDQFPDLEALYVGGQSKVFSRKEWKVSADVAIRTRFLGQLHDDGSLCRLYRNASCFIFPSFYEASPMPPTEAMANGCPVVASAIPPHHERLGDAVLYCDPSDPADIARKVATVLSDPGVAHGLRTRGLSRAREFSWHRCAEETLRVIHEVVTPVTKPPSKRNRGAA